VEALRIGDRGGRVGPGHEQVKCNSLEVAETTGVRCTPGGMAMVAIRASYDDSMIAPRTATRALEARS